MSQTFIRQFLSKSNSIVTPRCFSTAVKIGPVSAASQESVVLKLSSLQFHQVSDSLDELVDQGKVIKRLEVIRWVNYLRRRKKYRHALQLYQWMDKKKNKLTNADQAICIDLLMKTKGIESAETYFNSLQHSAKTHKTYGALLNCYCKENMLEKALELFEKMKELGFTSHALNYNNLISLYLRVGQPNKVPLLVQEMEEKNIAPDVCTYNQLMNSYASLKDFEAAEKVLERMTVNKVLPDCFTYGTLATVYINAGFVEKAIVILEQMEKLDNLKNPKHFDVLITLYAQTSSLKGVNRAWDSLKMVHPKPSNSSYLVMLLSLKKLGDIVGLETCFQEWESGCSTYDVRASNIILESYLDRDMLEEANLLSGIVKKKGSPNIRTFNLFMEFYLKKGQIDTAMHYLEKAASHVKSEKRTWFPSEESANIFLKHFEAEKDVDGAEKFCDLMKRINRLDSNVYDSLLRTYVSAGKVEPQMRQRMKEQGVVISAKTEELLERVCPESAGLMRRVLILLAGLRNFLTTGPV